jgi:sulfatase modifying factor 1
MMGSEDPESQPREKPVHKVQITRPFYLGKYPVTVDQFERFVEAAKYRTSGEGKPGGYAGWGIQDGKFQKVQGISWSKPGFEQSPKHPVVMVSSIDAREYCKWAVSMTGQRLRLPTEAEWEYAARGPAGSKYPWGDRWDGTRANHADRTLRSTGYQGHHAAMDRNLQYPGYEQNYGGGETDGYAYTSPVGALSNASWCGAYDLVGNVWQWCEDRVDDKYYASSPLCDPLNTSGSRNVHRGGSWHCDPGNCRAAQRFGGNPDERGTEIGFRAVMEVPLQPAASADADWQNAIDLLPRIDVNQDKVTGDWVAKPTGLEATNVKEFTQKIQPPYRPPEEYDYRVSFTPLSGDAFVAIGLTATGRSFVFYLRGSSMGFEAINGQAFARTPTARQIPQLKLGQRHRVVVQVRKDGLKAWLDGQLATEWATNYQDMSPFHVWKFKDDTLLGFGCSNTAAVFDEVKVREVTGKGSFTRP